MGENRLLDAALAYAEMGWAVIPLHTPLSRTRCSCGNPECEHSIGKHPRVTGWEQAASTDPATVRKWWSKWPDANIGIACGPSHLVTVDLDVKDGVDGRETWHELKQRHGFDDEGAVVNLTGGGGQHLVFTNPNGLHLGNSARALGPGIDTRGSGGQFVAPPSLHHSGKPYTWDVGAHPLDHPPAPIPEALARLLAGDGGNGDRPTSRVVGETIPDGVRDDTLTSLAGTLRNRGLEEGEILATLEAVNRRCDPPKPQADLERIAQSVSRYEPGQLYVHGAAPPDNQAQRDAPKAGQPSTEKPAEPPPTGWQWRTMRHAYEPKPPRQYIVTGLLPVPSLSIFYGTPGTLKSMLVQDAAVCVASGSNWLEGLPDNPEINGFPVTTSPVLWVDVDNGLDRLERRFGAIGRARELPEDAPLAWISFPQPAFIASDPASIQHIIYTVQETGAKLVIFDNLGTVSGGADENSSEMVEVMNGLRQITEFGQCAVIVIHHSNKGDRARLGDRLRGHSSIEAALDLALLVEREGETDVLTLQSTKTRDIPVQAFTALWTYEQDGHDELVKARFYGSGRPDANKLPPQQQAELCAIKDMEDGVNQKQLRDLITKNTDASDHVARAAIRRLVDSGKLRTEPGAHNAILYYRTK